MQKDLIFNRFCFTFAWTEIFVFLSKKIFTNIHFFVKTYLKNIALCAIAFLLFFFGNSVNVIHFCCDICRTHGTQVFTENICNEEHAFLNSELSGEFDTDSHDGNFCSSIMQDGFPFHLNHQHEACSMDRISIIQEVLSDHLKVFQPFWVILSIIPVLLFDVAYHAHLVFIFPHHHSGIPPAGRLLLNRICVLRH
jgi:hypothetical protein